MNQVILIAPRCQLKRAPVHPACQSPIQSDCPLPLNVARARSHWAPAVCQALSSAPTFPHSRHSKDSTRWVLTAGRVTDVSTEVREDAVPSSVSKLVSDKDRTQTHVWLILEGPSWNPHCVVCLPNTSWTRRFAVSLLLLGATYCLSPSLPLPVRFSLSPALACSPWVPADKQLITELPIFFVNVQRSIFFSNLFVFHCSL